MAQENWQKYKHIKTLLLLSIYTKFLSRLMTQEAHHLRRPPESKRILLTFHYNTDSLARYMEVISYPRSHRHD